MDRNNVENSNPPSQRGKGPSQKRNRRIEWESLKPDISRIYMDENENLETTKSMILLIPGFESFNACDRTWKKQLNEWGFVKNIQGEDMDFMIAKEKQRASEGKKTSFKYGGRLVEPDKIEQAKKRRKTRELSPNFSIPRHIVYHTPRSINESDAPEELYEDTTISDSNSHMNETKSSEKFHERAMTFEVPDTTNLNSEQGFPEVLCGEFFACSTPLPQSSLLSCFVSENSTAVSNSGTEDIATKTTSIFNDMFISSIDRYLSEKDVPWNEQFLTYQLGDHDTMLARQRQMLSEITDHLGLSQGGVLQSLGHYGAQYSSPGVSSIGVIPSGTSSGVIDETEDQTSESSILGELFDLTGKLANCQAIHGEFDPQTLELEFKLGKSCYRYGNLEEAEYHCRRILRRHAQVDVQSFLGMVLSDASRTDEARYLLFCALTGFISEFPESSMRTNLLRFHPIKSLYLDVIPLGWASLNLVMFEFMTTMEKAAAENAVDQYFRALYIHGYSMAHECFLLEMVQSAKYMYENLLHPARHLYGLIHGLEEAKARQRYSFLLRTEKKWTWSAQQLLLACECTINSGTHDQFIELLESDYIELLPLLKLEPNGGDTFVAKIAMLLVLLHEKKSSPPHEAQPDFDEPLQELPRSLGTLPCSRSIIYNTSFESTELPLRGLNLGRRSASRASTSGFSAVPSYKFGVSFSEISGCTGVSISGFLGP